MDDFTHWLRAQDTVVTHAFATSDILNRLNRNLNGEDPATTRDATTTETRQFIAEAEAKFAANGQGLATV
ncbi:hypothetical protein [Dinoroseobacter sp. S124A]|uniref:hypothetical protein n=1 Tax=Dinoroseobacter sp. S124A TaxID=3415128 RepID=UPI003C7A19C1